MSFAQAGLFVKVSFVLALAGFLFHIIGFSSEYWRSVDLGILNFHEGLWTYGNNVQLHSWFEATQAFETLGFIAALAALVLIVLYIFVPQTSGKRIICILSMLACFAAAGCIMLGIIIYGSKVERNLSWSFALCCIAGIIFGVSGVLLLIDMVKK